MIFLKVICNLHVEGSKFGGKFDKFGKKFNSAEFMELVFFPSLLLKALDKIKVIETNH